MDRDNIIPSINYKEAIITSVKQKLPYLVTGFVVLVILALLAVILYVRTIVPLKPFINDTAKQSTVHQSAKPTNVYVVKEGDSLWQIADTVYHDGFRWEEIAKANAITEPYTLFTGQKLVIPKAPAQAKLTQEQGQISAISTAQVTQTKSAYTIQEGDSLWSIAESAYGDGNLWPRIADANGLADPGTIHVGNTLKIPR